MPIYEYFCKDCKKKIELLILDSDIPQCIFCKGNNLERLFSRFASPGIDRNLTCSCNSCSPSKDCSKCG